MYLYIFSYQSCVKFFLIPSCLKKNSPRMIYRIFWLTRSSQTPRKEERDVRFLRCWSRYRLYPVSILLFTVRLFRPTAESEQSINYFLRPVAEAPPAPSRKPCRLTSSCVSNEKTVIENRACSRLNALID